MKRLVYAFCLLHGALCLGAGTNLISADKIPPLRPPRGEVPPGFWDLYSSWVIAGAAIVLLLCGLLIWLWMRPKPPPLITPPAIQARRALEPLRLQTETGALLSQVSQVVRHYFSVAYALPPAEMTTTEFCRALAGLKSVDSELTNEVVEFLRQCDERKFAAIPPRPPLRAAVAAERFIEKSEAARLSTLQARGEAGPVRG